MTRMLPLRLLYDQPLSVETFPSTAPLSEILASILLTT